MELEIFCKTSKNGNVYLIIYNRINKGKNDITRIFVQKLKIFSDDTLFKTIH